MYETNRLGPTFPREPISQEIQARVNAVAHAMRVTEATARREFIDEMIREMAQRMASELEAGKAWRRPPDLATDALAGRTSAGLAIAGQLAMPAGIPYFDDDTFDRVHQLVLSVIQNSRPKPRRPPSGAPAAPRTAQLGAAFSFCQPQDRSELHPAPIATAYAAGDRSHSAEHSSNSSCARSAATTQPKRSSVHAATACMNGWEIRGTTTTPTSSTYT